MSKIPESKRPKVSLAGGFVLVHDGEDVALYNGDLICRVDARDRDEMVKTLVQRSDLDEAEMNKALGLLEDAMSAVDDRLDTWPDPEPLPELLEAVRPFDFELLPGVLRGRVYDIAQRMQCPPDFIAAAFMTAISSVVGRQIAIRPKQRDDWAVVPNLYGLCIGRPGVLKTPAVEEVVKDVRRLETAAAAAYKERQEAYNAAVRVAKLNAQEVDRAIKKALREGKADAAQELARQEQAETPEAAVRERFITNDATVEKLGELLADSQRCILVYRDELTGFLRTMDREDRSADRAFYLEAWGGTSTAFTYDRIGRGTIDIPTPCVAILGSIQPGPLQEYIAGAMRGAKGDDGLLQRFQLAVWPDVAASWKNVDEWPDKESKTAVSDLFDRLASLDAAEIGAQADEYGSIPYLRFDTTAQLIFNDWRADLERRVRSGDDAPAFEAHLAKYRSLVPSIALLCHLIEEDVSGAVRQESLLRALAWSEYLESHARRIYAFVAKSDLATARELHRHIVNGDLGYVFTARDVYRRHWTLLDKTRAEAAIEYLTDLGHIREQKSEQATGRPRVEYEVNPLLRSSEKSTDAPDRG